MKITQLFVYPLKSGRGIALPKARVELMGLAGDRRIMLIDPDGHFITQRELPGISRLTAIPGAAYVTLVFDDGREMMVAPPQPDNRQEVAIWRSVVNAAIADGSVNTKLSDWLGRPVKLAFMDGESRREANSEWAGDGTPMGFADGYQILVTTTGSLAALNADMERHGEGSVGMDRFRPNIVLDCDEPFAEDRWTGLEIGGVKLDFVKPCPRCIMTTQDQITGSRDGANPMPAMGRMRMSADKRVPGPLFGWNAVPRAEGVIAIGDTVTILGEREAWAIKQR